jgi:thiopeptide-type bacteriocin biosynthesis protein
MQNDERRNSPPRRLFNPLNYLVVRTPLLSIEDFAALAKPSSPQSGKENRTHAVLTDHRVRRALAVASPSLLRDLNRCSRERPFPEDAPNKLLRYLIRMSSRPTPFGLFAGVALASWGSRSELILGDAAERFRGRPDAQWLLQLVFAAEERDEIRKQLRFLANPAAFLAGGRLILSERAPSGDRGPIPAVSLRATGAVLRVLSLAREPILYEDLATGVLAKTPGASTEKVDRLLKDLWRQTILLSDLRPPLTVEDPAQYVLARLAAIPQAASFADTLKQFLEALGRLDRLELRAPNGSLAVLEMQVPHYGDGQPVAEPPVQVDMAVSLHNDQLNRSIAQEAARAADLLFMLTPWPGGPIHLEPYKHAFRNRFGTMAEVPLLELLDPTVGLGNPYVRGGPSQSRNDPRREALRNRTLMDLALGALRDRELTVEIGPVLESLRLDTGKPLRPPPSVELFVSVAARSAAALDAGEFLVVLGPNLGAHAAGRSLGRFGHLLGADAIAALRETARAEESLAPDVLHAELVYLPPKLRTANVSIRPLVRNSMIAVATSAGCDRDRVIALGDLTVGLHGDRFSLRCTSRNAEVRVCSGHMLNYYNAPVLCRFLADISTDGEAALMSFTWGAAEDLPFLPRVQSGRIVLRPAQWNLEYHTAQRDLPAGSARAFDNALAKWREKWLVPRYVYLSAGDNRLLLDLRDHLHVEELRAEVRRLREWGRVQLQEAVPDPETTWVEGPGGRYASEFAVPLIRAQSDDRRGRAIESGGNLVAPAARRVAVHPLSRRLRPPGSDWLYCKLYIDRDQQEKVIAGPLLLWAREALTREWATSWFFLRYADPEPHLRIRFHGTSSSLTVNLLPQVCRWAELLMEEGVCHRFGFDTYEREVERYGGDAALCCAEEAFCADSHATCELLAVEGRSKIDRTLLLAYSIDDFLAAMGLTGEERRLWYHTQVGNRRDAGPEFRRHKRELREVVALGPSAFPSWPDALPRIFSARRQALARVASRLTEIESRHELSQPVGSLLSSYIHMHHNRLAGAESAPELQIFELLSRTHESLRHHRPPGGQARLASP